MDFIKTPFSAFRLKKERKNYFVENKPEIYKSFIYYN